MIFLLSVTASAASSSKSPPVCTAPTTMDTPPTIEIKHPASGQSFTTQTIMFNGIASDDVAISKVQVRVNNGPWQLATGKESWSNLVTLILGTNKLEVNATDTSGNSGIESVTVRYVDNESPLVEITSPKQGDKFTNLSITVKGIASDNFALDKISVQFDDDGWQNALFSGTSTSKSWDKTLTLARGFNTIIVMANDTSGNFEKDAVDVIYVPDACGNGALDAGEACDTLLNDCSESKPICSYCNKCIAAPVSPKPFASINDPLPSTIRIGGQIETVVNLENSFEEPTTYFLEFSSAPGTPQELAYWSWFNGHRKDEQKTNTSITLGPKSSGNIAIITFGGAFKSGDLKIKATSSNNATSLNFLKHISITYGEENGGITTETPEFGWTSYVLMALIGAFLLV